MAAHFSNYDVRHREMLPDLADGLIIARAHGFLFLCACPPAFIRTPSPRFIRSLRSAWSARPWTEAVLKAPRSLLPLD